MIITGNAALTRGHSNEHHISGPVPLTSHLNLVWTADIAVGHPARSVPGQSLFPVAQTSKLITKCAPVFKTFTPDMFLGNSSCMICHGQSLYNIFVSPTAKNLSSTATGDFSLATSLAMLYPMKFLLPGTTFAALHTG